MQAELEAKLVMAKDGLQRMMTDWKKEWRDQVIKWSEKITVVGSMQTVRGMGITEKCDCVVFPTNGGSYIFLGYNCATLSSSNPHHNVEAAIRYRDRTPDECTLTVVPINLAVDIFRHFVLAFGGNFSLADSSSDSKSARDAPSGPSHSHFYQYLRMDENERHRDIILSSLHSLDVENPVSTARTVDLAKLQALSSDPWQRIWSRGIRLGGKLTSEHYIESLLSRLRIYQMNKMVEYHFHHRNDADKSSEKMVVIAKRFLQGIVYRKSTGTVEVLAGRYWIALTDSAAITATKDYNLDGTLVNERELKKKFKLNDENPNWKAAMKSDFFVKILGEGKDKLTIPDVHFLICLVIDAEYDEKESLEKVTLINSNASASSASATETSRGFPTAMDHFSSFDSLYLRGTLAETVLSKKLQSYTLGLEEIRTGTFAEVAPTALTKIVADYYPIDIN